MDTRPEVKELEFILGWFDEHIAAKTSMIAEVKNYLNDLCEKIESNEFKDYNAKIQNSIAYSLRAREVAITIRSLVQEKLDVVKATPKKSLLVAGNIPAGCTCPFAKSIPCAMVTQKCPTEAHTLSVGFSCALARGFDLAEQEK